MNPVFSSYLLDADVLITAKNSYYSFRICPGFWQSLLRGHSHGRLHSIDQVRQELLRGGKDDDLVRWIQQDVPQGFFLASDGGSVVEAYGGSCVGSCTINSIRTQPKPGLPVALTVGWSPTAS